MINPTLVKSNIVKKYMHKGHIPLTNLKIMFRKNRVRQPRCSAYQRLDAKKALIGTTQVAYLGQKEVLARRMRKD